MGVPKRQVIATVLQAAMLNKLLPFGYVVEDEETIIQNAQRRQKALLA